MDPSNESSTKQLEVSLISERRRSEAREHLFLVVAGVLLVIAWLTNPSEYQHAKRFDREVREQGGTWGAVALGVSEWAAGAKREYSSYLVFSTYSMRGGDGKTRQISWGAFGFVKISL